jgi:NADH-quinone oxidoreductase subunit M
MNPIPILSLLVAIPAIGGLLVLLLPARSARPAAFAVLGASALAAFWMLSGFDHGVSDFQFVERHPWIPTLGAEYHAGVDGLGAILVLLTALLPPLALAVAPPNTAESKLFPALVLFLQAALFGAFTTLNFLHWFLYWELSIVPAYFLIKIWGGPGRNAAAAQFFIYTFAGSVAMLLAMQAVFAATGTFSLPQLAEMGKSGALSTALDEKLHVAGFAPGRLASLACFGVLLGLAVKAPMMPFHTWLPDAYAEAPSAVTLLLTGVMSKMGVYGMLRILAPLFPAQIRESIGLLTGFATLTVVASAFAACVQKDIKRVFAYSSMNHLGLCVLAVFAATAKGDATAAAREAALAGTVVQMFNHGLGAGTLFACVALLERRSGPERDLNAFGGLRTAAPVFAGLSGIAIFASLGLPGLNGFPGEFLIFRGVFPLAPVAAVLSLVALPITAVFLLALIQKVFCGPSNERWQGFSDLTGSERLLLGAPVALLFVYGVFPQLATGLVNASTSNLARVLLP